jgi:ERO1-like protein alpha
MSRVLTHPERIENLLFLYGLLIRSVKEVAPRLENYVINSENPKEDAEATQLLKRILSLINKV